MMLRFTILLLFLPMHWCAQDTLRFAEYQKIVLENHPVIQQAQLIQKRGDAQLLRAKGGFDPKLEAQHSAKHYNDKNYYSVTGAQLKMPTPFAMEFKGSYDLNNGTYLDPSATTGNQGLVALGVQLPLWQGLVIDERRATLRMAQSYAQLTEQEKLALTNDLLLQAYKSYWQWWSDHEKTKLSREIMMSSLERLENVKMRARLGQAAPFDTLEAYIQYGVRSQQWNESQSLMLKSRWALSTMLWSSHEKNAEAIEIQNQRIPEFAPQINEFEKIWDNHLLVWLDSIAFNHPELKQYDAKIKWMETEMQWKKEKIKPKFNLQYNVLTEPLAGPATAHYSAQNYKWGADFSFPLLAREARGDWRLAHLKKDELHLAQQLKNQEIRSKALTAYQTLPILKVQADLAQTIAAGYAALLKGERIKFDKGESSIFMVNQREMQYAEAQSKWIDLQYKLMLLHYELAHHLGKIQVL